MPSTPAPQSGTERVLLEKEKYRKLFLLQQTNVDGSHSATNRLVPVVADEVVQRAPVQEDRVQFHDERDHRVWQKLVHCDADDEY